jgi:hypothetical protein
LLEGFGVVWPTLGELCAPILPIVEPADGGDELCSLAPPEVSALPDGGMVADLDASGDVVFAVGGLVGVSAANRAKRMLEKGKNACLVTASLSVPVRFESEIVVESP